MFKEGALENTLEDSFQNLNYGNGKISMENDSDSSSKRVPG